MVESRGIFPSLARSTDLSRQWRSSSVSKDVSTLDLAVGGFDLALKAGLPLSVVRG